MRLYSYLTRLVSKLWAFVYRTRRNLYSRGLLISHRYEIPVISVGNLTFGGTGKTPVVIFLAKYFNQKHLPVAILTRGYRGKREKTGGVIHANQAKFCNGNEYGDEPAMIAQSLTKGAVIVGKNRHDNFVRYAKKVRPEVLILDDGFQHLKIARDLDIVIFDATLPLEHYFPPPIGYAREAFSSLKDAQLIVLSKVNQLKQRNLEPLIDKIRKVNQTAPIVEMSYELADLYDYNDFFSSTYPKKAFALAAIANPDSFFDSLRSKGVEIIESFSFLDHYSFKMSDLKPILDRAKKENVPLLCTEKDMAKIKQLVQSDFVFYPKLQVKFSDPQLVKKLLDELLV